MNIATKAESLKQELIKWRRHLHSNPELSFQEVKTSAYILEQLKAIGFTQFHTGIGGHGIVATISGKKGPVIGLRADMDALPIREETGLEYTSTNHGVMHACGHDAHVAMLLGAAKLLKEYADAGLLNGTLKLIFQPAEEDTDEQGFTGAPHLLRSGVIDDVKAAIALHVCPWRKTGELQVNKGPSMANIDNFILTIKGIGGHGGYPHQGKDPLWMASFVLQGIYSLISRRVNPLDVGAISVGEIHGGTTANIIPNRVQIRGTIRSYKKEVRQQLIDELKIVASIVESLGGSYKVEIEHGEPALYNDEKITEVVKRTAKILYPSINIWEEPFGMGGEDFGFIAEKIPSMMFFLGCGLKGELHSPYFQLDEDALPIGTALLTKCAQNLLLYIGGEQHL